VSYVTGRPGARGGAAIRRFLTERITRLTRIRGIPALAALVLGPIMIVGPARPALVAPAHPAPAPPAVGDIRHLTRAVTGRPAGIVHVKGRAARAETSTPDPGQMTYNGGPVEQHPVVYLVFWGSWWYSSGNPSGGGAALETSLYQLFHGIGQPGDAWSMTLSQYKDSSGTGPQFGTGVWGDWAVDTASTPPATATDAQIAAEAVSWADHWNVAGDANAQIVVVSPQGDDPGGGFPANYCAWHDQSADPLGKFVAYTNLPYLPDAGASCGAATPAGVSIVAGHEFAETVTDPGAEATSGPVHGAWYDGPSSANPDGQEIADKCSWFELGTVTLPNGPYAMQRLWSNASSTCVLARRPSVTGLSAQSGPTAGGTSVTITGARLLGGSVTFGAQPAAGTCAPTSCTVKSPPGSLGVVDVRVSTSGGQSTASAADRFSYDIGPGQITGANGHCLADAHGSASNGNKIDIWACVTGRIGQVWLLRGDHSLRVVGKCLGLTGLFSGARAVLASCAGQADEYWQARSVSAGLVEYVNPASGLCLTDPHDSTTNGTAIVVRACANLAGQRWSEP
jgi:serine protease